MSQKNQGKGPIKPTVIVYDYGYLVDFHSSRVPRFHRIERDGDNGGYCTFPCESKECAGVNAVRNYLKLGGQRAPLRPSQQTEPCSLETVLMSLKDKRAKELAENAPEIAQYWRSLRMTPEEREQFLKEHQIDYDYWE